AIRSNQTGLLNNARSRISRGNQVVYQDLLSLIRLFRGPRLLPPQGEIARGAEVLGPDLAVLSHGLGDLSSQMKVIMRRVRPGDRPWYARYFATEADGKVVSEVRRIGFNPVLNKTGHHHYEGDPPFEAVYIRDPIAQILYRTVQVQLINVPSFVLDRLM